MPSIFNKEKQKEVEKSRENIEIYGIPPLIHQDAERYG
jgi:hypothetical protein